MIDCNRLLDAKVFIFKDNTPVRIVIVLLFLFNNMKYVRGETDLPLKEFKKK